MNSFQFYWRLLLMAVTLSWGMTQVFALTDAADADAARTRTMQRRDRVVTQAEREAAADRLAAMRAAQSMAPPETWRTKLGMAGMPMPSPDTVPDYSGMTPNWAYSPPLRKFIDTLPGLGPENANELGQYIPVANPDTITYPGSDYYEIAVVQYKEKLHTDLPRTLLRGYVQLNKGTNPTTQQNTIAPAPVHYLGPFIVAQRNRPIRIKFTNMLPTGEAGNLFIPVDTTVMGAGMGPLGMEVANYTQNRAVIHLHGGRTPWISDGTPHQWITPIDEDTPYKQGDSLQNVPDMPDPGPGSTTYYFTNQQSARLMFYHDHVYGITRLNVYAGMAAGYMITDEAEQGLIDDGVIPADQIPLIIQDKTFVDADTIETTDPLWRWGSMPGMPMTGDLWLPHVYMPAQNPSDLSGMNAMGRWHYGPWFWPPTTEISHEPIPNPYYDPENAPWQPEMIPDVPHPSMGMESFFDTPLVNGTAFPTLTVEPKAYRLRILNAANDRFWNLQLYLADDTVTSTDGRTNTEVKMVPAKVTEGFPETWPTDGREGGVPDPATAGPSWLQIGTEGGFLPKPALIPNQPITWNTDPTTFNMGNVQDHSMLLAPAERADVIVDFSQYANKTLILYNDAPTAFPALDPRTDYYTGAPDMTDTGGHWGPQAGFGPNTRTIMQIRVADTTPADAYDPTALEAALPAVFAASQDPIIIPNAEYNEVYGKTFSEDTYARIFDTSKTFKTTAGLTLTVPFEPKAIQDEMGEAFDDYGRMSGKLGLEVPNTNAFNQNFVLQNYVDPPTEIIKDSMISMSPIANDGTQIWKITHNGVDTHPIHFHLMDVQLINRVGWDGAIRPPDANELGWKDTVRVSPLEDTIVAMRPVAPKQPFGIPDSIRLLDPTMPEGSTMGFSNIDPYTGDDLEPPTTNQLFNFGWEYMWHCHILSHEEMEMMRPISFLAPRELPSAPVAKTSVTGGQVKLTWTDATPPATSFGNPANEIGFRIERSANGGTFEPLGKALANATSYTDTDLQALTRYNYRVIAYNAAGDSPVSNTAVMPGNITLTASPASPQMVNTPIMLTTTAIGAGTVEYRYRLDFQNPDGSWTPSIISDPVYGGNTCPWTPTVAGNYRIIVWAREVGQTVNFQRSASMNFTVYPAPTFTNLTITANSASPRVVHTPITLSASVIGGGPVEYRFKADRLNPDNTWTSTVISNPAYGGNTCVWTPTSAGTYRIIVWARDVGVDASYQATAYLNFVVKAQSITALSVTASSPRNVNSPITLTATATSGGPVEYRFRADFQNPDESWTTSIISNPIYGGNTCVWTPTTAGTYRIIVWAREVGQVINYQKSTTKTLTVTSP